jgi:hypothetical protein
MARSERAPGDAMVGTGRNEGQNQPGHDGDDGSCERKPERYRGRLLLEARLGLGLGIYRWHLNIVAPDGSTGELAAIHSPSRASETKTSRTLF